MEQRREFMYVCMCYSIYNSPTAKPKLMYFFCFSVYRINSNITINQHNIQLDSSNALSVVNKYDVVLDCSDNVPTRYLLNDACVLTKVSGLLTKSSCRYLTDSLNHLIAIWSTHQMILSLSDRLTKPFWPYLIDSLHHPGVISSTHYTILSLSNLLTKLS